MGDKGTPQEPRQHLVTLARAERPQGPAVCTKGRQLQAGTTEGSGGGPGAGGCSCDSRGRCRQGPGDPGCSAWLPAFLRARLRGASRKPGTMRLGTRLVGDVTTSQGRSRPRPRCGPGRCACAGLRWGASCTLGSVIPGMSLIRSFCHGEASPGPLIRSHSPGGLPPALSHADNSQGTRGGGGGSGHRP